MARFISNPGNAVHSVEEGEFKRLTLLPGYREATEEEIALWHAQQGLPVPSELSSSTAPKKSKKPTDATANRSAD